MYLAAMTKSEFASFVKATFQDIINEQKKTIKEILPTDNSEYCTIVSLTERFKVTKATVHNWAKRGTIKKYKVSGRTLYKLAEIEKVNC